VLASVLLVIDIIAAITIIVLVLLQQGKGSDMGAAFGGGGSQSVFGSRGSANFFSRATAAVATIFFVCSLGLAYVYSQSTIDTSVTDLPAESAAPEGIEVEFDEPAIIDTEPVDDIPVIPGGAAQEPVILDTGDVSIPEIPQDAPEPPIDGDAD
jgi:preprotein translocase subunit SecG